MNANHSLSIVLPVYNEEENIQKTIEDSLDFLRNQNYFTEYEVIAVDDGSLDQTASILKRLQSFEFITIITNPQNLGYGGALVSGIKHARYSWLLLMDSDGQFKINSIQKITKYLADYDIITGYRHRRADTVYRDYLGKVYTRLACRLFGLKLKDINCGFKLFKKEALYLNGAPYYGGVFYTDIFIKAKQSGLRIKEVPIEHFPRVSGKQTGANVSVIFKAATDLAKLTFQRK